MSFSPPAQRLAYHQLHQQRGKACSITAHTCAQERFKNQQQTDKQRYANKQSNHVHVNRHCTYTKCVQVCVSQHCMCARKQVAVWPIKSPQMLAHAHNKRGATTSPLQSCVHNQHFPGQNMSISLAELRSLPFNIQNK